MANYDLWLDMARDSYAAGEETEALVRLRSAASRFYYAAYQAATALLLYRGLTPPDNREAWSHDLTPQLALQELETIRVPRVVRFDMRRRLLDLYQMRVVADYQAQITVTASDVGEGRRDAGYILRVAENTLPRKRESDNPR